MFPVTILKCTDSSTSGLLKPQSRNTGKESLAEEEEESTYMSPEIHVDSIQTCPESLQVSEPQTTIGMHHSMHKQTAFKGTLTPSSRVLSEESFGLLEGKFKLDFHKIFEDVLETMEHEANMAQPASFDSEYRREVDLLGIGLRCDDKGVLDMIPTGQESYVSDEPMGQINRSRIGHTCDPNPSNHLEVLLESKADMTETYVSIRKTINLITWLMDLMSSTSSKSTIEWVPPGLPAHEISKERFSFMRLKGLGNF